MRQPSPNALLDRVLSAELAEHRAMLAQRPPDVSRDLEHAGDDLRRAERAHQAAVYRAFYARGQLEHHNPLSRLRLEGRDDHARRMEAMDRASRDVRLAAEQLEARRAQDAELRLAQAQRVSWDAREGWREAKAAQVTHALAHHWAQSTLAVARQGDPLAFGTDRLREARATYSADLERLRVSLPLDVSDRVSRAEADLCRAERERSQVVSQLEEAEQAVALARERRWGRIDKPAREAALRRHDRGRSWLEGADAALQRAQGHLGEARADQARYEQALAATAAERQELSQAVADLDAALDQTRPQRVLALAQQDLGRAHLVQALGPLPEEPGPRAVWLGLAEEVERFADHHPGRGLHEEVDRWRHPELLADQDRLHELLARAPDLLAAGDQLAVETDRLLELSAGGWAGQLEQAQSLAPRLPEPGLEQSLGMDVGW